MTHAELVAVVQAIAPVIRDYVTQSVGEVRERQLVLETKATAAPVPDPLLMTICERIAVLETRPVPVAEKGEKGDPGRDGAPGTPGLTYQGGFQDGKAYAPGDVVTWGGHAWHCYKSTTVRPDALASMATMDDGGVAFNGPNGKDFWSLLVKRGDRGRDGKDAK